MRTILATIAFVMLTTPSWGGDFDKGVEAFNNGDYATAIKEWTPLAEQGDVIAQYNLAVLYEKGKGVLQDHKTAFK